MKRTIVLTEGIFHLKKCFLSKKHEVKLEMLIKH